MEFGDVYTVIGPKGVVSAVGESNLRITISSSFDQILVLSGGMNVDNVWIIATRLSDFPDPVGGVIYLTDNTTYVFTKEIDFLGSRLQLGRNTTILGASSENCRMKSTSLINTPLISSVWSAPIRNITIEADLALSLDAAGNSDQAIDWNGVNFTNCRQIGTVANYNNFVMSDSAFINSAGLKFSGSFNTIAFDTCLFTVSASAGQTFPTSGLHLTSSLAVARRFRAIYSSFVVPSGCVGIMVDNETQSFPNNDSFILDTVNFSGTGTALSGTSNLSNKATIANCVGVENSADTAQYYMDNNATATNTTTRYTFYKVSGSTTQGYYMRKFLHTDNRATYIGSRSGYYLVSSVISFNAGTNQEIAFRLGLNGQTVASSEARVNANSNGRAESITTQGVVFLSSGSYVEVFAANNSSNNSHLTVSEMNTVITRISS